MKAIYYEGSKKLVSAPAAEALPGPGDVRIRVAYAGICGTDLHIYHGHMDDRVTMPQVMGHEMSGVIENVGEGVEGLQEGDKVTVMPLHSCGQCPACEAGHSHICHKLKFLGIETPGAFQTYWTVPAFTVHKLPESLDLKLAAMVEPLAVACHDVRMGSVEKGDFVLVIGGGPIGALIAMAARENGARVLVSEINPYRLELLGRLGFETVNPLDRDVLELVNGLTAGKGADVVFEVTSTQAGAELMTKAAKTRGRIVVVGIFNKPPAVDLHRFFFRELQLYGARVYETEDFASAIKLADEGRLPLGELITDVLPLEQVEDGFRKMESGGNAMKILLNCGV
ncbi:2-desacetyl-2-hydroxyethyl bacteriochlorophyllide A dehydrogenase [Paenibacillus cellulosilyticus]|uniref:2-desacetyl-2-hydroxyethyl bacteriochlorophyllide A dehydrogenase n=1 Tax=Paenibacillus cellulosilyticus TaxID=375489 RepID=A0A2V2YN46_9BACL|nr:alcohol dehydrogenase catalytic domain-containing protein [Paenibacillus cellulosilyticus]PWV95842.1 2-desacetyl-2-hydroxyethyl bacteriochlorophyllide A dehydrogenase [Paenibacillus cellulosilyticus]QKS47718.1 alcohol dehydrogenase catalytic domain-containing protein [Paenibacillus cellulosilyticus]